MSYIMDKIGFSTFCLFQSLTGFPCPGCGMTRAFIQLSQGHIREAIALNPMSMLAALLLLYQLTRFSVRQLTGYEVGLRLNKTVQAIAMMGCAIAVWGLWLIRLIRCG